MGRFLVIIPAYNEEKNIGNVLEEILDLNLDLDILVVNDGSTDRTADLAKSYNVTVLSHISNLGYGAALQTGYKYAAIKKYPYIIQFDADGQHDPKSLENIYNTLVNHELDVVIGSRFLIGSTMYIGPLKRFVVIFFRMIIYLFTGEKITDPTSGLRGMNFKVFRYFSMRNHFPTDYPDADLLIQMLLNNYKVAEVPTNMRDRVFGKSVQHAGIKPFFYMVRIMLNIFIIVVRYKIRVWVKNNA